MTDTDTDTDIDTDQGGDRDTDTQVQILRELFEVVEDRRENPSPESYTSSLFEHEKGINAVLEKIGEESTEVVLAAKDDDTGEVVEESADLIYHLLVLLAAKEIQLDDLLDELRERRG
ncbi:MAG: phosphoribosyl-ATP diphosphatase [Halobacteria archaeon]|nr:phosphoribosyl-ATP diphosphatase [Halobacteria archaeon]